MAPRSSFSREHESQVKEHCEQLIRGTLQESATPENVETALEWCLHCIAERRHGLAGAAGAAQHFRGLLEKLRAHSQLDAAEYLEEQRAAFLACRLSQRHTREAHAAALQAMLLLARQPTRLPLRMVRSLRAIREGRHARAAQQRRSASEQAHDRRAMLELELRQVAEAASQPWREAWAAPDLVPEGGFPAVSEAAPTEASAPASAPSSPRSGSGEEGTAQQPAQQAAALPRGALPRQPWLSVAPSAAVTEQALVEAALQMLAGHAGGLVGVAEGGGFAWRPARVPHLSAGALRALLVPLAELGTALHTFRSLAAVVQATVPWLGHEEVRRQVARAAVQRRLCLRELAELQRAAPPPGGRGGALGGGEARVPDVFGLCWQGACLALEGLVEEAVAEFRSLQASSYRVGLVPERAACEGKLVALTLVRLDRLVAPRLRTVSAVRESLDAALVAVAQRCCERPAAQWPEAAAEELLAHLARALRSAELAGEGDAWLGRLWCGAMCPPVQAMQQWGTTGTLHDPCNEFRAAVGNPQDDSDNGFPPSLLLKQAVSSGRHVQSLQQWSQVEGYITRWDPSAEVASLSKCIGRSSGTVDKLQRCGGVCAQEAPEMALAEPYVPLEVKLEAHVLRPALQLAEEVSRPLLLRVLQEESGGLLRHLAALRLVAFLERDDVVSPLTRRLLEYVEGCRLRAAPLHLAQDALAIDLNSALLEGLEQGTDHEVQQLCARNLVLALVPEDAAGGRGERDSSAAACLERLRLLYTPPPPLERVLGEPALRAYASVMALLLRVRHAEAAVLEVNRLPLFGLCDRHRRVRSRRLPVDFIHFAHGCDMFRMEVTHFLGCVERYLQVSVIQSSTRTLQGRLHWLVDSGSSGSSGSPRASPRHSRPLRGRQLDGGLLEDAQVAQQDVVDRATQLHAEYVHQLMQECFLAPELHAVLTDIQQLLGMAVELRDLLAELAEGLQPREGLPDSVLEEDLSLGDHAPSMAGGRGFGPEFFCQDAWHADSGVLLARQRLADLQREFRRCVRYLLKALMFSVGRGTSQQVSNLCSQINFNGFYHEEA